MWQKLSKSYPIQLEPIPLFLLFLTLYLTTSGYHSLPDQIPTHFGPQGFPDAWGNKSEILIYPILCSVLYLGLTVLNILFAIVKDPRKLINLPEKRKAALNDVQVEALRIFLNRSLFALKVLLGGMLTYSLYVTMEVAMGRATSLGIPFTLFITAIIVLVGYMVWGSFRLTGTPKRAV
ncbi:MAG: DUF1648 domain-containing protein [Chloroflexota bacterium]